MNGYYDKDSLSLKGAFKPHTNNHINAIDPRIVDSKENFNQDNKNKIYQPNIELLAEIERTQKLREYQRHQRKIEEEVTQ